MTLTLTRWRGRAGRALLLVLAVALIPQPVAASETTVATKAQTSHVSLKAGAARAAARTPLASAGRVRRAGQDTSAKASPGFFKTRQGAVALVVMVVGAGYAIYSAKNDRITSPAKK